MKYDCSDILEKIEWARNNDDLCKKIADTATSLVLDQLQSVDNHLYLLRALRYYETLQNFGSADLRTNTNSSEWIKLK